MYESFFGLREPPFNVTPDPQFFFANSCYNEAFATLRYGITGRKGFIVVTGEPGTGKTTLLKRLLSELDPHIHTAWIFHPHLGFPEVFRLVLSDLGLPTNPRADRLEMLGQFYDYLLAQFGKDHIVALLIDEAQDLSDNILEELRLLSNLEASGTKLLQIVLIGQPELESRLDHPSLRQLKQRIVLRSRIVPLANHEIGPYIDFRLATAGCAGRRIFAAGAVEQISQYSKGVPRIINVICDNALLIAYAKSQKSVTAEMVAETVADLRLEEHPPVILPWTEASPVADDSVDLEEFEIETKESENREDIEEDSIPRPDVNLAIAANPPPVTSNPPPIVPNPTEARWLGLAAAVATLVWVLAVVEIFSYRAHEDYLSVVSEPIEKFKAVVAPIPEQIRNALMTRSRDDEAVRLTSSETVSGADDERSYAPKSSTPQKTLAEKTVQTSTKPPEPTTKKNVEGSTTKPAVQPSPGNNSGSRRNAESGPSRFKVVGNSFVREEPTAGSEIIATLRPGTEIKLMGKRGEYFRVGALSNGENIRGYVHKEDAFFEPLN
jgi:general secretion pathway protein A